jgi:hypothetical protein
MTNVKGYFKVKKNIRGTMWGEGMLWAMAKHCRILSLNGVMMR